MNPDLLKLYVLLAAVLATLGYFDDGVAGAVGYAVGGAVLYVALYFAAGGSARGLVD